MDGLWAFAEFRWSSPEREDVMQLVSRTCGQKLDGLSVARILLEVGAVGFRLEKPYILTSGWASPVYVDCRRVISYPYARRAIVQLAAQSIIHDLGDEAVDAVAGGETAGIPYAAWLAETLILPMLYVRKKPKGFGHNVQIEGYLSKGQRVLLVDDQATDGASKANFCRALRTAGAIVDHVMVVFYYGVFPLESHSIEEIEIQLHYLTNWWDILEVVEQQQLFNKTTIEEVRTFFHRPALWSAEHGGRDIHPRHSHRDT